MSGHKKKMAFTKDGVTYFFNKKETIFREPKNKNPTKNRAESVKMTRAEQQMKDRKSKLEKSIESLKP